MTEKFIDRKNFCFCRLGPENLSVTKFFGQIVCLSHKAFRIALSSKISKGLILDAVMRILPHQDRRSSTAFGLFVTVARNTSRTLGAASVAP